MSFIFATAIGHTLRRTNLFPFLQKASATYFTNAKIVNKSDPYAILGLSWGATTSEIKNAYKEKARVFHPDLNREDSQDVARRKFQAVQEAYQKLMDVKGAPHRDDLVDEWSFAVWRNSDIIAQDRTDVAGVFVKRPAKPAGSIRNKQWGGNQLGHPDGSGMKRSSRAEYLTADNNSSSSRRKTSTVGTGRSKWHKWKQYKSWNPPQS
mmetsp:Transcript_19044/g.21269  ORF Transcript_19044/g.21269 Transcript_19044/m.21269 type:complete len:208 (+) Transcript_19044:56-679(+)